MEKRTYSLHFEEGNVVMSGHDFAHLCGELTNYGVDVQMLDTQQPGKVTFRLTENPPEQ